MFQTLRDWVPPPHWTKITAIDAHAAGEPLRVIVDGIPQLSGETMLARQRTASNRFVTLRTSLMWEPRGHREMFGCILTPPVSENADFGVIFMHNDGYSAMCGHGIIAVSTVAVETGLIPSQDGDTLLQIDTPAGLVRARARVSDHRVRSVSFRNVPSFVLALDRTVDIPGLGCIRYDLAFGGCLYAYVQAESLRLRCLKEEYAALRDKGMIIKRAVMAEIPVLLPDQTHLSSLHGVIFIAPPREEEANSRNTCVFANGQVDRSPTGTGVSGRLAIASARGEIGIGDALVIESILGSRFTGRVVGAEKFGAYSAVITEVEGSAHITGIHQFLVDPDDDLAAGFLLTESSVQHHERGKVRRRRSR
jgi:proline racemase